MAVNPSDLSPYDRDLDDQLTRGGRTRANDDLDRDIIVTPVKPVSEGAAEAPVRPTRAGRATKKADPTSNGSTAGRSRSAMSHRRKFEARKVRRLIRHIDPWSVLKLSLVFFFCLWLVVMIAGVIVWQVAISSGTIGKIESFLTNLGLPDTKVNGEFLLRQFGLIGLIVSLAASLASTVSSVIFNLISDLVGGVWITVIEEETGRVVSGSPEGSEAV